MGGKKKESAAEKCHLQPDTGTRAFTNLPVTVTAWRIATSVRTELNRHYTSCKKLGLLRFLSLRQVKRWRGTPLPSRKETEAVSLPSLGLQQLQYYLLPERRWQRKITQRQPHLLLSTVYFSFTNSLGLSFFLCLPVRHQTLHLFALVSQPGKCGCRNKARGIFPENHSHWVSVSSASLSFLP